MRVIRIDDVKDIKLASNDVDYSVYEKRVQDILAKVKEQGDSAVFDFTKQFDGVNLDKSTLKVTVNEIREAYDKVSDELIQAMKKAIERITAYHSKQKSYSWFDRELNASILGQMVTPIERVGLYVPGGTAVYPSSVFMNAIPAIVAGVQEIVMVTPPNKEGSINAMLLVAADLLNIKEIYKLGGAQAIGALAYGTETIKKVHKIVGPGNIYVALAKQQVFGHVGIDAIAGPSEILIIADETANPKFIAADLMSQAEHDVLARCFLVTTSPELIKAVEDELTKQMATLSRKEIIAKSLEDYGYIYLVNSIEDGIAVSNEIAPEHLELCFQNAMDYMTMIKHAGAIFIGDYSPEPLGDYMAGPNHVLPTSGTAKFFSPLGVQDFIKRSSIIKFSKQDLMPLSQDIMELANNEGLTAHANSIAVRREE